MSSFAYPGVDWPRIGAYLWVTVVVVACAIAVVAVVDFVSARSLAALRPRQLRSAPVKRWRIERRIWLSRVTHPTNSFVGRVLEFTNAALGLGMLGLYIASTYQTTPPSLQWSVPVYVFNTYFIAHWLLRLWTRRAGRRLLFVLSPVSLADIASIVSALLTASGGVDTFLTLAFLRVYCVYDSWLSFAKWRATSYRCTRAQFIGVRVIVAIATFAVIMSATVATIERAGEVLDWGSTAVDERWHTLNAVYFTVVTMGTVGYGDLAPQSALGRLCICVFIISGAILFSLMAAALIEVSQENRLGEGAASNPTGQLLVLLTGSPDRRQLCDVLDELFHPAHPNAAFLHTVILLDGSRFVDSDARWFAEHPSYSQRVTYLRGSVFDEGDLARAVPREDSSVFSGDALLRRRHRSHLQAVFVLNALDNDDDTQNELRAIALQRHLPGTEVYVLLSRGSNLHSLQSLGIPASRILARDIVREGFIAANTATPGAATLLINLFSSDSSGGAGLAQPPVPRTLQAPGWCKANRDRRRFNPAWLALRSAWRAERDRRHFTPGTDDVLLRRLDEEHGAGEGHFTAIPVAVAGSARTENPRSLWSRLLDADSELPPRPAWHAEYEEGLEQEIFQFATPDFLSQCTLLEATCVLFATPLAALLVRPSGDPDRVHPAPKTWEELVFLLATHPALRDQQGPVLVGTPAAAPRSKKAPSALLQHTSRPLERIYCNLKKKYLLRAGEGSILVLLRDRSVLPRIEDVKAVDLRGLVQSLLWDYALRTGLALPGRPAPFLARQVAVAAARVATSSGALQPPTVNSEAASPSASNAHVSAATVTSKSINLRSAEHLLRPLSRVTVETAASIPAALVGSQTLATSSVRPNHKRLPMSWLSSLPAHSARASEGNGVAGAAADVGTSIAAIEMAVSSTAAPPPPPPLTTTTRVPSGKRESAVRAPLAALRAHFSIAAIPEADEITSPKKETQQMVQPPPPPPVPPSVPLGRCLSVVPDLNQWPASEPSRGRRRQSALVAPLALPAIGPVTASRRSSLPLPTDGPPSTNHKASNASVRRGIRGVAGETQSRPRSPLPVSRAPPVERQPIDATFSPPADLSGHIVLVLDDPLRSERLLVFLSSLALRSARPVVILCHSLAPPDQWLPQLRTRLQSQALVAAIQLSTKQRDSDDSTVPPAANLFVYGVEGDALGVDALARCRMEFAASIVLFVGPSSWSASGGDFGKLSFGSDETLELIDRRGAAAAAVGGSKNSATDVRAVLATLLLEHWLVNRNPALLSCVTTEFVAETSYRLFGPVPVPKTAKPGKHTAVVKDGHKAEKPRVADAREANGREAQSPPQTPLSPLEQLNASNNENTDNLLLTLGGLWPLRAPQSRFAADDTAGTPSSLPRDLLMTTSTCFKLAARHCMSQHRMAMCGKAKHRRSAVAEQHCRHQSLRFLFTQIRWQTPADLVPKSRSKAMPFLPSCCLPKRPSCSYHLSMALCVTSFVTPRSPLTRAPLISTALCAAAVHAEGLQGIEL